MKHYLRETALGILLLAPVSSAVAADVTMPDPNYATATAVMNVIKDAAEQELGLDISTVTTTAVPVIWEAMARNKGEVDIWPDVWLPNQQGLVDKYVKGAGTVKLAQNGYEAKQGYCVTQVTVDKYGIKDVSDLANPDNAKLFDTNGDGKGEMWIGASGWQSTNIEKVRARDYGPHQNFARYKLAFLTEPKNDPAKFVVVQPNDDPQWFEKSKVSSAYADTTVHVAYAASLAQRQPDLAAALERIQFNPDDISKWAYAIIVDKKPADEVAKEWIKAHPGDVAKWFGH